MDASPLSAGCTAQPSHPFGPVLIQPHLQSWRETLSRSAQPMYLQEKALEMSRQSWLRYWMLMSSSEETEVIQIISQIVPVTNDHSDPV